MVKKFFSLLLVTLMILSIGITKANRVYADTVVYEDNDSNDPTGVKQGDDGDEDHFYSEAILTDVFIIDEEVRGIAKNNAAKTYINPKAENDGFVMDFSQSLGADSEYKDVSNMLIFKSIGDDGTSRLSEKENVIEYDDGPIATYTFKNAALLSDGSLADVVVAYEKITLIPSKVEYLDYYGDITFGCGNGFHGSMTASSNVTDDIALRLGVKIDAKVYITKNEEKAGDAFYFPIKGLTNRRSTATGWQNDFPESEYSEDLHYFNEGVIVNSGYKKNDAGHTFFVPGGKSQTDGVGYTARIDDNGKYFYANLQHSLADDSIYAGFVAVADNTDGIDFTYIMGIAVEKPSSGPIYRNVNNNLLYGITPYQIKATTGVGGDCETTVEGNPNNDLSDGSKILKSNEDALQTVPGGKTVTYKMTPKPGYKLKSVIVKNGSTDVTGGTEVEPTPVKAEDGTILYYTYTFKNINEDNSLHVEWEPCDYHIDYDANGGEGTMDPQDFTGADETMKSKDNAFTREGYHFTGFKALDKDGNPVKDKDGKELPLFETAEDFKAYLIALGDGAKITLQAQWEPDEYTIKYDPNGGEGTMTEQHFSGTDKEAKSKPNEFTAGGFDFVGFKAKDKDGNYLKDKDGNDLVFANPADFISYLKKQGNGGEITLVAQWRKKEYKSPIPKTGVE